MTKYIFKRILLAIISLILLVIIIFFLMKLLPGFPIHQTATESIAEFNTRLQNLGLLDSPVQQFFAFVSDLFTKGDFGIVYTEPALSVVDKVLNPMVNSFFISIPSFVFATTIGIGLGIAAAYFRGRIYDFMITIFVVIFNAVPSFVLGIYFLELGGAIDLPIKQTPFDGTNFGETLYSSIMPILAMTITSLTAVTIYTRNELVEVFKQDYIKTALSKGLSFPSVLFKHALRNAGIPILSIVLPSLITILSGSIIVENFFEVAGASRVLVDAITDKETFVVLFSATFFGAIYFALQIIMDLTYSVVDPRIVLATKNDASMFEMTKSYFTRQLRRSSFKNSNSTIELTMEGA